MMKSPGVASKTGIEWMKQSKVMTGGGAIRYNNPDHYGE